LKNSSCRQWRIFPAVVSPWYDKNNRLAGSIHVAKDITNERLLHQRLVQSEKLSAIGELVSGIAHELNNPLTGVMDTRNFCSSARTWTTAPRRASSRSTTWLCAARRSCRTFSPSPAGRKPERTFCDINQVLEQTVELRTYEFHVENIDLVLDLDRNLPRTIADAHQLQQVFLNIINNAEQAMLEAHGRGRLVIRTQADARNARLRVEITDDGPGIPEAFLTRIFDPFFTTKEVGKGTGLGLSLSYGIIREHDGNIYALSRVGEGSTFVVELPIISRLQEDPEKIPQRKGRPPQFENLVRDRSILVVDDEKYILDFFVEVFRTTPLGVDIARDGNEALEKIARNEYDLVFADLRMPHMSGRDLYSRIRSCVRICWSG